MRAVVVGGNGFVGMNVARALHRAGHDVVATRKEHANTLFARKLGVPLVRADLDDVNGLVEAMRDREVVFMCAGHYPRFSLDAEREIDLARGRMERVLLAARLSGVKRFVLTGSIATVGPPRQGDVSDERDPIDPRALRSVYHRVKLAIEEEALAESGDGLEVIVLLPTAIIGELDVKAGTGFLIVALANGMLPYFVDGRINVVDADDLAHAHIAAAERGRGGERYIVGGHDLTVSELLERVASIVGVDIDKSRPVPAWIAGAAASFAELRCAAARDGSRPFLARELVDVVRFGQWVSSEKAVRELALAEPTPLQATLEKACGWYRRHRYIRIEGDSHAQRQPHADSRGPRGDHPASAPGPLG